MVFDSAHHTVPPQRIQSFGMTGLVSNWIPALRTGKPYHDKVQNACLKEVEVWYSRGQFLHDYHFFGI